MNSLLTTAYWPNLHYFYYVLHSDSICIEQFENYQKQSFRNRTCILSANGPLNLVIPIKQKAGKELTRDIEISYAEAWQIKHWRAITSAYKNSPYFDYFESEIEPFYSKPYPRLMDYNLEQMQTIFKLLKINKAISMSESFQKFPGEYLDLRHRIHPKVDYTSTIEASRVLAKSYYQTFENKFAFVPNLSILDLLFNTGLGTVEYLKRSDGVGS